MVQSLFGFVPFISVHVNGSQQLPGFYMGGIETNDPLQSNFRFGILPALVESEGNLI